MKIVKKMLAVLLAGLMLVSLAACGGVKGTPADAGRVSTICPEGWLFEPTYSPDDLSMVISKAAKKEDIINEPSVTIYYGPQGSMLMSARWMYPDAKDIEPLKLGEYEFTGYTGKDENFGSEFTVLETEGDFGSLQVHVITKREGSDKVISLEDKDVKAIIENIKLVPEATADWFTLKDGVVTVNLQEKDGRHWSDSGSMYTEEADVEMSEPVVENNVYTVTFKGLSDGVYRQTFAYADDDYHYLNAEIAMLIKDGKIIRVPYAVFDEFHEPQPIDHGGSDERTPEDFLGTWIDINDNTVKAVVADAGEGNYHITVTYGAQQYEFDAAFEEEAMNYHAMNLTENGATTTYESDGYFKILGDMLLWTDFGDKVNVDFAADLIFVRPTE